MKDSQDFDAHLEDWNALRSSTAFSGILIGNGASRTGLAIGYVVGGGIMIIGGLVEIVFGIDAEGKPLEQIAAPLTVIDG